MEMSIPPYDELRRQVATVLIRAYAAYSYLYYEKDESLLADDDFDKLCVYLLENLEWIKPYDLNNYLDEDSLFSGSGYHLVGKVVGQTKDYAELLLKDYKNGSRKIHKKSKVLVSRGSSKSTSPTKCNRKTSNKS